MLQHLVCKPILWTLFLAEFCFFPCVRRSMEIPSGLSVTLFKGPNYTGAKITYTGPMDARCLDWEGWGGRTSSIKIEKAESRSKSEWRMRIYKSTASVSTRPSVAALHYVGSGSLPFVALHDASWFRKYVPGAPPYNFAAQLFGVLQITQGGMYTFCDTSDDGSRFFIGGKLIILRNGWGATCKKRALLAGRYDMMADMFQVRYDMMADMFQVHLCTSLAKLAGARAHTLRCKR